MTYDRPSQRPTLRAPALHPMSILPLPPPDSSPRATRARSAAWGQWLVVAVAMACGTLLGVGATLRWARTSRAAPPSSVAQSIAPLAAVEPPALHLEATPPPPPEPPSSVEPVAASPRAAAREVRVRPRSRTPDPAPVEVPAPSTAVGPPRYPDAPAIRSVVTLQHPRLRQCYTTALRQTGSAVAERVEMTVDIAPAGTVESVSVTGAELGSMASCLERTAARWTFPRSRRGARVPLTFVFRPSDA